MSLRPIPDAQVACESGDAIGVTVGREGVLLVVDDIDLTIVPTARLTSQEARRLGAMLLAAGAMAAELGA